jgi:predicted RNA methylase
MLRHFFRMFVDEYISMLDLTCGSGTSLRAAESLGAQYVLGLELDPTNRENAVTELNRARTLAAMAEEI